MLSFSPRHYKHLFLFFQKKLNGPQIISSTNRLFSCSLINRTEGERKEPLSYSEQITRQVMEQYKNYLENADDKARFDVLKEKLESHENEQDIQTIIRNIRKDLVDEPTENIKQVQEAKMDDKRKQQFEMRKKLEIERRKQTGNEKKDATKEGGIEYRVVERG